MGGRLIPPVPGGGPRISKRDGLETVAKLTGWGNRLDPAFPRSGIGVNRGGTGLVLSDEIVES